MKKKKEKIINEEERREEKKKERAEDSRILALVAGFFIAFSAAPFPFSFASRNSRPAYRDSVPPPSPYRGFTVPAKADNGEGYVVPRIVGSPRRESDPRASRV